MPLLLILWLATQTSTPPASPTTTVVPKGVILVKGATPSASDSSTPVPEYGTVSGSRYRNAYFGLTYPIPAGWKEQPAGPPPSEGGVYVLTQLAVYWPDDPQRVRAHVLVTAHDLFFSDLGATSAKEVLAATRGSLPSRYEIENGAEELNLGGRTFHRLAYTAPHSHLHWRVLTTDLRCHALTFTFTGTDTAVLDAAERALAGLSLARSAPACVRDYAQGENLIARTDPQLTSHRFNTIPVRLLVDANGRVKHIHLLSAFPEQSQPILDALRTWRFKPYRVDGKAVPFETGIELGMPRVAPPSLTSSARRR